MAFDQSSFGTAVTLVSGNVGLPMASYPTILKWYVCPSVTGPNVADFAVVFVFHAT